jgi:hypothetical protein
MPGMATAHTAMPTPAALITNGTMTDSEPVDETGLLISNVGFTATRKRTEFAGADGNVKVVKSRDPRLVIKISGVMSTSTGFVLAHPGTAVTTIANYGTAAVHGFSSTDGFMVYGDVTRDLPQGNQGSVSAEVTQFPFGV